VGVSGEKDDGNSSSNFVPWFAGLLSLLAAVATVLGMFVKITPIEIDTGVGFVAVGLFVVCAACAGAAVWSHRHRKGTRRQMALFVTVAVVALLAGTMLAVGSAREKSESPTAAGTPTIGTQAPTTTTSTTAQGGPGLDSEPQTGGPEATADGQDGSPNTARSTATGGNPTQPDGGPASANDAVRYQGEFRLSAAQEGVDLDTNPPAAYGPTNELSVEDHAIWTVPPDTKGVAVSGSPTRAQCVDAVDRANPPAEYFDNPQPGDGYCVRTSDGRYALVRVVSAATKDFTLALTVWS
jgi:hypothetical protein